MEKSVFLVLASPVLLALILLGSFVLGSLAMFLHVRASGTARRFRRISYILYISGLFLAVTGCLAILQFAPAAAAGGWLGPLGLALPVSLAVVGAGYVHAGAGRSMDIEDTTDLTWLIFVPFVALWLVVKRGMDRPLEPVRSDLGEDIGKLVLVALPIWLATTLLDELESSQTVASRVGRVLVEQSTTADQAADLASVTMARSYFWSSFAGYPLGTIRQEKNEIRLVYSVPENMAASFDETALRQRFEQRCRTQIIQSPSSSGIVTTLVFARQGGETLATFSTKDENCVV